VIATRTSALSFENYENAVVYGRLFARTSGNKNVLSNLVFIMVSLKWW